MTRAAPGDRAREQRAVSRAQFLVRPAKAGIQQRFDKVMDSRLRRNDKTAGRDSI
jgi:hypothetical protein